MNTTWFTITNENAICAFATEQEALDSDCRFAFSDIASLETILTENEGLASDLWNQLPGIVSGSAPGSISNAAGKIWKRLQPLASAVHAPAKPVKTAKVRATGALAASKAPKASKKATPAKKAPKAKKAAKPAKSAKKAKPVKKERAPKTEQTGPREGTKAAKLVEMLKRPEGATLKAIVKKFDWLPHTTRALLSAGGALAKKGIVVESFKPEDGERTYRIAS